MQALMHGEQNHMIMLAESADLVYNIMYHTMQNDLLY